MTRDDILREIRRIATDDGGVAPGQGRFIAETGLTETDWRGRYWARWSDAIREAGLTPNEGNVAFSEEHLLANLAQLTKELGRFPVQAEIRMKARRDNEFPSHNTFSRFGGKNAMARRLHTWCVAQGDEEAAALCVPAITPEAEARGDGESSDSVAAGYVYLVRHGSRREYKIGRTNNPLRREGELRTELPEQLLPVHQIETDDPSGVEKYWHVRFPDKRKNGEWFALNSDDVRAFKRWKRIF
jgi:hypothetical protein